ncbi:p33 [Artaxa digramma nucleopolyhedrovirus]|uniref:P33 n=1 Tax=Artaxa digramma nucleopolyhedrovirus TaxID=3070910 RepID=A0AAE6UZT2_9ABAC|nr:p33 [Euproctis digramma nucleopolyhedrovirus]QHB21742.1 p33 [Artaxa digramma nucleopolyhedrovirus]
MIPITPLFLQYKDSFLLFTFRHLDRMRTLKSKHLAKIMATELTYLYHIACVITYKEVQQPEIEQLKNWILSVDQNLDLEQMKLEFNDKMVELNLRSFLPNSYSYTFTTIWNVIHFLAMLIDDMVHNRQNLSYEFIVNHMRQMKAIYYNLFFKLDCAMCRDHYLNIRGYLIMPIERVEICLNRERFGEPVVLVDELNVDNTNQNVLMKNGVLYASMVFHNHINEYKWVQRNMKPPADTIKMEWGEYKKMLKLN